MTSPPVISGFKPYGNKVPGAQPGNVFLAYEEYEALKLCDYKMLNHHQAALIMRVSRPTLTRIYARARQKIADALVLGKQIIIEGGKIYYDSEWFSCSNCGCYFNNPDKEIKIEDCPLCGSIGISIYDGSINMEEEEVPGSVDACVCPACGYEKKHLAGIPCKEEVCPQCSHQMVRKGAPHDKRFRKSK